MSNLGSMVLELSANVARLQSDLGKASAEVRDWAEGVSRTVEKVAGVFGVAFGADVFKDFISGAIESQEQALLLSQKVGIATDSVVGLVSEAKKFGVDQDSLQQGLIKMSKSAAEAANGVKQYASAYTALGINVKDSNGNLKSSEQLLGEIADKFASYEDGVTKTADATVLFGKAGANLIPLLNQGSAAMERQIKLAKDLGASIGTEAAEGAEKFKHSMADLGLVSQGVGNQIATALLPALNRLADAAIKFFTSDTWKSWLAGIASAFTTVARHLDDIIAGIKLLGELAADYIGIRLVGAVTTAAARMATLATATLAANSAAAEMGISWNAGVLASIKQIGVLNAALGTVGAAVAGLQIGTYLYNEFAVVRQIANNFIATFDALWTVIKAGAEGAWLYIQQSFYTMLDTITGRLSDSLANMAASFAKLPDALGGSKLSSEFLALSAAIAPTGAHLSEIDARTKTLASDTQKSLSIISTSWDSGGRSAAKMAASFDVVREGAKNAMPNIAGLGKAAKEAMSEGERLAETLEKEAATFGLAKGAADFYTIAITKSTAAERARQIAAANQIIVETDLKEAVEASAKAYQDLVTIGDRLHAQNEKLARGLKDASEIYAEYDENLKKINDAYAEAMKGSDGMAKAEAQRLQDMAEATKNLQLNFDTMLKSLQQQNESPFTRMVDQLNKVNAELVQAKLHVKELGQARIDELQAQITHLKVAIAGAFIGTIGEALKGIQSFSKEGSKSYEEMRIAIDTLAVAQAVLAVISQGSIPPPASFVAMAAMAAAVAPLLADIGASISAVGAAEIATDPNSAANRQATQGTGTVLGDITKQSESIQKAMDITANATSKLVAINTGMLYALQSLQQALGAAGTQLARGAGNATFPGFTSGNAFNQFLSSNDPLGGDPITKLFSSALFGGSKKIIDQGIDIAGGMLGDMLNQIVVGAYQTIHTSGGLFGGGGDKTNIEGVSDEFAKQFQLVIGSIADAVRQGALALGLDADAVNAAINSYHIAEQKISLQGLSAEDQQKALEAVFSSIFDGLAGAVVPFIGQFQKVGEGLGETLVRVATEVQVTQEAVRQLGLSLNITDPEKFAQVADGLIQMAGGVDAFIDSMNSFVNDFAPQSFKFQTEHDTLQTALQAVGLTLPTTRDGFWKLMQSLDASTEAGQKQIATLLRLTDVANTYYNDLDKQQSDSAQATADFVQKMQSTVQSLVQSTQQLASQLFGTDIDQIQAKINKLMAFGQETGMYDFRQITALKKQIADEQAQQAAAAKLQQAGALLSNFGQLGALTGESLSQLAAQFHVPLDQFAKLFGTDQAGLQDQFDQSVKIAQASLDTATNTQYANELLANILAVQQGLPPPFTAEDLAALIGGPVVGSAAVGGTKPAPVGATPPGKPRPVGATPPAAASRFSSPGESQPASAAINNNTATVGAKIDRLGTHVETLGQRVDNLTRIYQRFGMGANIGWQFGGNGLPRRAFQK